MDILFLLKKIISHILMPLPLGIVSFFVALIWLYTDKIQKAKKMLIFALVWMFVWSYPPIVDNLLYKLESTYPTLHHPPKDIHYIYLLGGGHNSDKSLPITSEISSQSIVRFDEALRLYRQLPQTKVILSGYGGLYGDMPHAYMQQKLALALGIKPSDIILAPTPKDTHQEALKAKEIINHNKFILVTSAYHMKRAMIEFANQNLHPIPAPTNHLANTKHIRIYDIFSSHTLYKASILWHEYLGLLYQQLINLK